MERTDSQEKQAQASEPHRFLLTVPFLPSSVKTVRLVMAGIANHQTFSIDEIEDVKIAVGEVMNFFLYQAPPDAAKCLSISVLATPDTIETQVHGYDLFVKERWGQNNEDTPSLTSTSLLDFLVDEVLINETDEGTTILFRKKAEPCH